MTRTEWSAVIALPEASVDHVICNCLWFSWFCCTALLSFLQLFDHHLFLKPSRPSLFHKYRVINVESWVTHTLASARVGQFPQSLDWKCFQCLWHPCSSQKIFFFFAECFYFTTSLCFFFLVFSLLLFAIKMVPKHWNLLSIASRKLCFTSGLKISKLIPVTLQCTSAVALTVRPISHLSWRFHYSIKCIPVCPSGKKIFLPLYPGCLVMLRREASSATQQFPFCIQPSSQYSNV